MHFAYVTKGKERRLCEITNLFDDCNEETSNTREAIKAVIKWDDDLWISLVASPGESIDDYVQRPA